ncbi:hypothetical protein BJ095_12433 [Ureibacillus chungkukjangi]|uniref:Uncharacterized protein n=1 Tax=Ureibacillus chungkukjangi TaxID=1202712 RepID=A0A318TIP9_9BACL|nr:hypothetical protein BJ095_12433 [Ureibacillus chungkukjangi]
MDNKAFFFNKKVEIFVYLFYNEKIVVKILTREIFEQKNNFFVGK